MAFASQDYSDWILLDEGGQGEVFRARHKPLDRLVAVKRLKLAGLGGRREVRAFEREARLSAGLDHVALARIYDYGREDRFYYLVMEYVDGVGLARLGDLPEPLKRHLALQLLEAVDYVHGKGILHHDLKPDNFLVTPEGRLKMLDLGMARPAGQFSMDDGSELRGTLAYFPPEAFRGQGRTGKASEYYSAALVLFELFAGQRLFAGGSVAEVVNRIQSGLNLDGVPVPSEIRSVLAPFLRPDPAQRPESLEPLLAFFRTGARLDPPGLALLQRAWERERKSWLLRSATLHAGRGEFEACLVFLKELLELDPGHEEAAALWLEAGSRLNESAAEPERPKGPPGTRLPSARPARRRAWRSILSLPISRYLLGTFILLALGAAFYFPGRSRSEDLGERLAAEQWKETGLGAAEGTKAVRDGEGRRAAPEKPREPQRRPYGTLQVLGLDSNHRIFVNGRERKTDGEVFLPLDLYFLEIRDRHDRPIYRDSIRIAPGEPQLVDLREVGMRGGSFP